jgi:hypothetical protein
MIEKTDQSNQSDYSCEIASFVVLVILSALSHFCFIVIGICGAMVCGGAIVLLLRFLRAAAADFPRPLRARGEYRVEYPAQIESGSQVFQPSKIRQSVDC